MTTHKYLIMSFCTALHAGIEIENRSSYPFIIKSITYEHNDGLRKTPYIEPTAITVAAHSRLRLPYGRPEPILLVSGVHNNITYTVSILPTGHGTLVITPDNRIELLGGVDLEEKVGIHNSFLSDRRDNFNIKML